MSRWHAVKTTLAVAMFCGLALSPRLWLSGRNYPLVPVWDGLPAAPPAVGWAVLGVLAAVLVVIAATPRPRRAMAGFVLLAGVWSLWDQTRWQPWFYQYLVMFAVLALCPVPEDPERGEGGLNACRLVVAGTYFWSGLQKFNVIFILDVFPTLIDPVLRTVPAEWHADVLGHAWLAAYLECAIGLGLLAWPLRPVAVVAALAMHAIVLFCLGPRGDSWNTVVWPWNVAMMVFVVVLFGRTRRVLAWNMLWPRRCTPARIALVSFGVLPLFNFYGWWDSYLSAALYSGNTPDARLFISQGVYDRLPPEVTTDYVKRRADVAPEDVECEYEVDLLHWPMGELNVPYYPAERVWRGLARRLAALPGADPPLADGSGTRVILTTRGRADWLTADRKETTLFLPTRPPR